MIETYIFIHGAFQGSWIWDMVSNLIKAKGHNVYCLTLPGMAEKHMEVNNNIRLDTHIDYVCNFIEKNDLRRVTLVGHGYGGMVVSGVADRDHSRIKSILYLDAFLPENNESLADLLYEDIRENWYECAEKGGKGFLVHPPSANYLGLENDPMQASYCEALLTSQPLYTLTTPIHYKNGGPFAVGRRYYVQCKYNDCEASRLVHKSRDRVKNYSGWTVSTIDSSHECMLLQPMMVSNKILQLTCDNIPYSGLACE